MSAPVAPARWVSAESFPVGSLVWDRPELGAVVEVRPVGSVHGVPMVLLVGVLGVSPVLPASSLLGEVPAPLADDAPALIEVAPASSLSAGPVLGFLAPWLVGEMGSLSVSPSDCSRFGFSLRGRVDELRVVSEDLRARFGEAVLVGDLEPLA